MYFRYVKLNIMFDSHSQFYFIIIFKYTYIYIIFFMSK